MAAVTVGHFGRQRREAAEVIEGGGMPRRWQMKKVNSALVRRAPWGIEWAARREEAPRRAQARRRAVARGLEEVARRVERRCRERAWEKTVWVWRCARRRMLAMDGRFVEGSKRREWTVSWRSES